MPDKKRNDKEEYGYVRIPVSLIPELYRGLSGFNDVMTYGFYRAAQELEITHSNVARRIVYEYLNKKEKDRIVQIPKQIIELLEELDEETGFVECNEDYRGFYPDLNGGFDPEGFDGDSIIYLLENKLVSDEYLWNIATLYYRFCQKANQLQVTVKDFDAVISVYERYKSHDRCKAWAYVKFKKLLEYAKRKEELMQEDIEIYAAHIALKSIIGKKKVGRTESKLILARMAGCVSTNDCTSLYLEDNPLAGKVYKKYSCKDNFRRLMGRLRDGFVKYIETLKNKNRHGIFFSFTRDLSKKMFEEECNEIIKKDKKEAAKIRKRKQRRKMKMGCRPVKGVDTNSLATPPEIPE